MALALGKSIREVADFPAWEIRAWMAYYSIEPWDVTNLAVKAFLSSKTKPAPQSTTGSDADLLSWAQSHNARLQAKKKGDD